MVAPVEALIKRHIFASEEEAMSELVREYILRQVDALQEVIRQFERKYGMNFQRFDQYLHERSGMLEDKSLPGDQLKTLGEAVMQEEDDLLEWKIAWEMLENWLGLRQEIGA